VDKLYDSLPAWGEFRTDKSELLKGEVINQIGHTRIGESIDV